MRLEIGRRCESDRPLSRGLFRAQEDLDFASRWQQVVVLRGANAALEIERIRAQVKRGKVLVRDLDRAPFSPVGTTAAPGGLTRLYVPQ